MEIQYKVIDKFSGEEQGINLSYEDAMQLVMQDEMSFIMFENDD